MHKKTYSLMKILFTSASGIIILILATVSISITTYFTDIFHQMSTTKYEEVFEKANEQLSMIFYDVATLGSILENNSELTGAVNLSTSHPNQFTRLQNESKVQQLLATSSNYYKYIRNIYLYKNDNVYFIHDSFSPINYSAVMEERWFQDVQEGKKDQVILTYDENYFIYAQSFCKTLISKSPGVLLVLLDASLLQNCLENINGNNGVIISAFDSKNTLLYTQNTSKQDLLENHLTNLNAYDTGAHIKLKNTTYILAKQINPFTNWTLVSLTPKDATKKDLYPIYHQIVLIVLIALLISMVLTFFLSRVFTRSFKPLIRSMERSAKGDFTFDPYTSQVAEINVLIDGYDDMLHRISDLISRMKNIEEEKRKTELEILQAQINPHFTYNTLNSIRWLALMQDSPQIAEMISSFSTLLQITSSHPNEFILVDQELQEVSCYVDIMKFRYNASIDILFEVQEQTRRCKTLKLLIQPLVENCFYHAFSDATDYGRIVIRAYLSADALIYEVEDNGEGISFEGCQLPLSTAEGIHNIGLTNINKRIQLWFGEKYGISFHSELHIGTKVIVTQPIQIETAKEVD
ncbi:sensor histidine kinase [uncultured Robinsoniella sp.]|uniref:sensor histidine kinase n=1 Tax=uncultured Robinsoniella sp. TaxID=904190 RepID=UPI00374F1396